MFLSRSAVLLAIALSALPLAAQPLSLRPAQTSVHFGDDPVSFKVLEPPGPKGWAWALEGPEGADLVPDPKTGCATFLVPFVMDPTPYRILAWDPKDTGRRGSAEITVHPHKLFVTTGPSTVLAQYAGPHWRWTRMEPLAGSPEKSFRSVDGWGGEVRFRNIRAVLWLPRQQCWLVADQNSLRLVTEDGQVDTFQEFPFEIKQIALDPGGAGKAVPRLFLVREPMTCGVEVLSKMDGKEVPDVHAGLADRGYRVTAFRDGSRAEARFGSVLSCALDPGGDLLVADYTHCAVRRVTCTDQVTTVAGRPELKEGPRADGPFGKSDLGWLAAMAMDAASGDLYAVDLPRSATSGPQVPLLRRIQADGGITTQGQLDPVRDRNWHKNCCLTVAEDSLYLTGPGTGVQRFGIKDRALETLVPAPRGFDDTCCGPLTDHPGHPGVPLARIRCPRAIAFSPSGQCVVASDSELFRLVLAHGSAQTTTAAAQDRDGHGLDVDGLDGLHDE